MREFQAASVPKPKNFVLGKPWAGFKHLDLEIGSGNGHFAVSYAKKNPERALIALERTDLRSKLLLDKAKGLSNLFAFRADAVNFVTHYLPDETLENIFLLYPNPYPKAKQANQRWANMPFMGFLLKKLKPGGSLFLATNIESYFLEAQEQFQNTWGMRIAKSDRVNDKQAPRTQFEKKYLERGENCWNLQAIKADS